MFLGRRDFFPIHLVDVVDKLSGADDFTITGCGDLLLGKRWFFFSGKRIVRRLWFWSLLIPIRELSRCQALNKIQIVPPANMVNPVLWTDVAKSRGLPR